MNGYRKLIEISLKLAAREKIVLFFSFLFPLLFFFAFGQMLDAAGGGFGVRIVSMVLVLGVLGNGLFGAGIRAVVERETNILRRYKVTPISPAPILVASLVTGWLLYLPVILLVIGLAHFLWGVEIPEHWFSLLVLLSVGAWAMRAIGLIVASVANSTAESNIIIQLLYMPMLFLSGATFPLSSLPEWAQVLSQYLPASYLHSGMERVMIRGEGLGDNLVPVAALLMSTVVATLISMKIFRWEKDEVLPRRSKLWLLVVGLPFILLGSYQAYSRENVQEAVALDRALERNRTRLIRGARIFTGDGRVIESGGILIRKGRIAGVFDGAAPDPGAMDATVIEAAGKTILPGLIDMHVHLGLPGGVPPDPSTYDISASMKRNLAAYLYSGVTAVRSVGDASTPVLALQRQIRRDTQVGADLFVAGPQFTTRGGYGTEYFAELPEALRKLGEKEMLRLPVTGEEARQQVRDLKDAGVDIVSAILDRGSAGALYNRMDLNVLHAIAEEARQLGLPVVVHTGDAQDVADAIEAGATGVEHGSMRERLPDELLVRLKDAGVTYDPTLTVAEATLDLGEGNPAPLSRSLVAQVAPPGMITATRGALASNPASARPGTHDVESLDVAFDNLRRAHAAGVTLVTGSGAGKMLVLHGPGVHRELQLWVEAGIPAADALRAATANAARALGTADRIGFIQEGYDASLLVVDGNPLEDISATERISIVFFKGERLSRASLFDEE